MLNHRDDIALRYDELQAYGQSYRYVRKAVSVARKSGSGQWVAERIEGAMHVLYSTLPARTKGQLPPKEILEARMKERVALQAAEARMENRLEDAIQKAIEEDYVQFTYAYYKELAYTEEKARALARCAAVLNIALGVYLDSQSEGRGKLYYQYASKTEFYQAYLALIGEHDLPYLAISRSQLLFKLRLADKQGITDAVRPPREGNQLAKEFGAFHQYWTKYFLSLGKNYSAEKVHELLTYECSHYEQALPSLEWVKKYAAQLIVQNSIAQWRFGKDYFNRHVRPVTGRIMALGKGDCWMVDGTKLQMAFLNRWGKVDYYNVIIVLDVYSGYIVGFSLAPTETRWALKTALKLAISHAGFIPREIMTDGSKVYGTDEIKTIFSEMELMGCKFSAPKGQPTYKSEVERQFSTLQTKYFKQCDNYIGEGMKSKRKNARPSIEVMARILKGKNLPDENGLLLQVTDLISLYNAKHVKQRDANGLTPSQYFKTEPHQPLKAVDALDITRLFWLVKRIKVYKSQIALTVDKKEYRYNLVGMSGKAAHTSMLALNGQVVEVRYDEDDMRKVYVFDTETREALCEGKLTTREVCTEESMGRAGGRLSGFDKAILDMNRDLHREAEEETGKALAPVAQHYDWRLLNKEQLQSVETQELRRLVLGEYNVDPAKAEAGIPAQDEKVYAMTPLHPHYVSEREAKRKAKSPYVHYERNQAPEPEAVPVYVEPLSPFAAFEEA